MDGHFNATGTALELNWFEATPPRVGSVTVKRRRYGQLGGQTWQTIAEGLGPVMRYTDTTVRPGIAYEYQVLRTARDIVDVGYWLGGTDLPAQPHQGHAHVIVDDTIAEAIAPRLARFVQDLTGDGWQVTRRTIARHTGKNTDDLRGSLILKDWLLTQYAADPFARHVAILVGHVPIVKSGKANPDGHEPVPHATDLFYADMDGRWHLSPQNTLQDNMVPGDFIEMQIGRIDFKPVNTGSKSLEIRLLREYFDKNHHWRMGYLGDLRTAYGTTGHLAVERAALRNVVGGTNITNGGHHDVGEEKPWLWGVDFGDWNGSRYAQEHANKAVFAINFGSHKQKFDARSNGMTALLAQPWYPIAVGWGARPAWWLHHMALGGTIGDVHMRTVNNGKRTKPYRETMDYFPTGNYMMRNPVWVNLLGDPTLRAFPLAAPQAVTQDRTAQGIRLQWQASLDEDVLGYQIFRADNDATAFTLISGSTPVKELTFLDKSPLQGAVYMVRAYGKKRVYAGSFHTFSQGAFSAGTSAAKIPEHVPARITSAMNQPLRLPPAFHTVTDGKIHAFIEDADTGLLTHDAEGWIYTPPAGFSGRVDLRFSRSGNHATTAETLRVQIGN